MRYKILLIGFIVVISLGCSNKDTYLKKFDAFVSDTEKNYKSYSQEKWIDVSEEYEQYSNDEYEKYQDKLTEEDLKAIGSYKYRYLKTVMASEIDEFSTNAKNSIKQLEGFIEAMKTN